MKLSNKILIGGFLSVIVFALLFIVILSVGSKNRRSHKNNYDFQYKNEIEDFDLLDDSLDYFSSIELSGAWEVELLAGSSQSIKFYGSEYILNNIILNIENGVLNISLPEDFLKNYDGSESKLIVTLPEIELLKFEGAGDITIDGFKQNSLAVEAEGLVNIVSERSTFNKLSLKLDGMGNVDFSNTTSKELHIKSSMMGNLEFGVDNANVSGSVDGMGAVTFYGTIKENSLNTTGMVEVNNK